MVVEKKVWALNILHNWEMSYQQMLSDKVLDQALKGTGTLAEIRARLAAIQIIREALLEKEED